MDFKQLNTFITVSELLNFTKAAERLGYAQSSITAQIQQLENELGTALFERIGKKVILTDSGKKLIPFASQILELSANMKNAILNSETPSGSLTVGTAESLSIYRLPEILKEYHCLYPQVVIELKLMDCSEFLPGLSNGIIDIAFAIGSRIISAYAVEAAALPEEIQILAAPDHRLIQQKNIVPKDFQKEPLLLTGKGCCYRNAFLKKLSDEDVIPRIVLETDSIQVIKQAAVSGLGICVLPAVSTVSEVAEGRLVPLNFTTDFDITSQLLYHKDKYISAALDAFIKLSQNILNGQRSNR